MPFWPAETAQGSPPADWRERADALSVAVLALDCKFTTASGVCVSFLSSLFRLDSSVESLFCARPRSSRGAGAISSAATPTDGNVAAANSACEAQASVSARRRDILDCSSAPGGDPAGGRAPAENAIGVAPLAALVPTLGQYWTHLLRLLLCVRHILSESALSSVKLILACAHRSLKLFLQRSLAY